MFFQPNLFYYLYGTNCILYLILLPMVLWQSMSSLPCHLLSTGVNKTSLPCFRTWWWRSRERCAVHLWTSQATPRKRASWRAWSTRSSWLSARCSGYLTNRMMKRTARPPRNCWLFSDQGNSVLSSSTTFQMISKRKIYLAVWVLCLFLHSWGNTMEDGSLWYRRMARWLSSSRSSFCSVFCAVMQDAKDVTMFRTAHGWCMPSWVCMLAFFAA